MPDEPGKIYTLPEAAEYLRLHPRTVSRYVERGRIGGYRLSERGDLRFTQKHLDDFLASVEVGTHFGDSAA